MKDYRQAKNRVIFLDNEGTLAPDKRTMLQPYGAPTVLHKEGTPPDPHLLACIKTLAADKANIVIVLSGREPSFLDNWFGSVTDLGLCAEHGFFWVWPRKLRGQSTKRWHCLREDSFEDYEWKEIVLEVMKLYCRRVQGSVIQNKDSAITWNYRAVSAPLLAKQIALELVRFLHPNEPEAVLHGYPVTVVSGSGYIEVRRRDMDKGVAVRHVLDELRSQFSVSPDFVLCIGDDRSDEDMFEAVNKLKVEEPVEDPPGGKAVAWADQCRTVGRSRTKSDVDFIERTAGATLYTVTVGRKPSNANFFVRDVSEVSDLLQNLSSQAAVSNLARHHASMPNFAAFQDEESSEDETGPGR